MNAHKRFYNCKAAIIMLFWNQLLSFLLTKVILYPVDSKFIQHTEKFYASAAKLLDFVNDGESSAFIISKWIKDKLDRNKNAIPPGSIKSISSLTLVILFNAITSREIG